MTSSDFTSGVRKDDARSGISLLEVLFALIVLTLLGLLAGPSLLRARESARVQLCRSHFAATTLALHAYHDTHRVFPPAANWNAAASLSPALHFSRRIEEITHENWAILLLPYLDQQSLSFQYHSGQPIGAGVHAELRETPLAALSCPSDRWNTRANAYCLEGLPLNPPIRFARGNIGINGGSHNFKWSPPSSRSPHGDPVSVVMDDAPRRYELWGNGIAGINHVFRVDDFTNGQATLVAFDELRAGVHPLDPRGVWSLGQIGGSLTWAHGVNGDAGAPNNRWSRSDDIRGCPQLHEILGEALLIERGMPCVHYVDINQQATSRSQHPGGVHVAMLDGSTRFISDQIDPGLWHVIHSRETPADVLKGFDKPAADSALPVLPLSGEMDHRIPSVQTIAVESPLRNSLGMEFVLLPAGEFLMGLPDDGSTDPIPAECPPHRIEISHPYWLGRCEVTQRNFAIVMGTGEEFENRDAASLPITNLSWNEALQFCQQLSQRPEEVIAGRVYRLPTEAEWEYACRRAASGGDTSERLATAGEDQAPPGLHAAIPQGRVPAADSILGLRGNAWEWTADWFARDYYSCSPTKDPQGPPTGYFKVVRGTTWRFSGETCRIDYAVQAPWKRNPFVGFRVVCETLSKR
jgi:formylglycine-generating enzyme required for sulfatase activity